MPLDLLLITLRQWAASCKQAHQLPALAKRYQISSQRILRVGMCNAPPIATVSISISMEP